MAEDKKQQYMDMLKYWNTKEYPELKERLLRRLNERTAEQLQQKDK